MGPPQVALDAARLACFIPVDSGFHTKPIGYNPIMTPNSMAAARCAPLLRR